MFCNLCTSYIFYIFCMFCRRPLSCRVTRRTWLCVIFLAGQFHCTSRAVMSSCPLWRSVMQDRKDKRRTPNLVSAVLQNPAHTPQVLNDRSEPNSTGINGIVMLCAALRVSKTRC